MLSLEVTPADVIGRCDRCRRRFREGDLYCEHLAAQFGHPIAWLSDQPEHAGPAPAGPSTHRAAASACTPVFLDPGAGFVRCGGLLRPQ